ncbi:MAG: hypothetical protein ACI4KF_04530 [Huintestinicola sp.]
MGFFDLFRPKKSGGVTAEMKKKLASLREKRVNYVYMPLDELDSAVSADIRFLTGLAPVNYYALKDEYIEAVFYSDSTHDENYVIFRSVKNDVPTAATGVYPVPKDVLRKAFSRLGAVDF